MAIPLNPLNDLTLVVTLKKVNALGTLVPLDAASVTAFLATDNHPTVTEAAPELVTTPTYTGAAGKWIVTFSADNLLPGLLDTHFSDPLVTPWCIIQVTGGARCAIELEYKPTRVVKILR